METSLTLPLGFGTDLEDAYYSQSESRRPPADRSLFTCEPSHEAMKRFSRFIQKSEAKHRAKGHNFGFRVRGVAKTSKLNLRSEIALRAKKSEVEVRKRLNIFLGRPERFKIIDFGILSVKSEPPSPLRVPPGKKKPNGNTGRGYCTPGQQFQILSQMHRTESSLYYSRLPE